jgi:Uri superfamily endonuclease
MAVKYLETAGILAIARNNEASQPAFVSRHSTRRPTVIPMSAEESRARPSKPGPMKGAYLLHVRIRRRLVLEVGKLGKYEFRPGSYIYVGSALNSVMPRLQRHFARSKPMRWHIDYLTAAVEPDGAWIVPTNRRVECSLARAVSAFPGVEAWPRGFGSSDCRCAAHLFRLPKPPEKLGLDGILPAATVKFDPKDAESSRAGPGRI